MTMAKKKSRKPASQAIEDATKALSLTSQSDPVLQPCAKDEEELELEKLVFGDVAGFQEALRQESDEDGVGEVERLYFSDEEDDVEKDAEIAGNANLAAVHDDELFFYDTSAPESRGDALVRDAEGDVDLVGPGAGEAVDEEPAPAWVDSDDERVVVSLMSQNKLKKYRETFTDDLVSGTDYIRRLRAQYQRVYPVPSWALPQPEQEAKRRRVNADAGSEDEHAESDIEGAEDIPMSAAPLSEFLQSTGGYISKENKGRLLPGRINISRLRDANYHRHQQSAVQSVSFHPTHPLLLSTGFDHTLRLYHIDGKNNPPVNSLYIPSAPLRVAEFHPDGHRIFAGGRRSFFHIWNLETGAVERVSRVYGHGEKQKSMESFKLSPCGSYLAAIGRSGKVNIFSATTGQWVATAQVDGVAVDLVWYPSSAPHPGLTIANKHGELFEYDMTSRSFSSRWLDEGGVNTSKIAFGGGPGAGKFIAVGSACGMVNIYDRAPITKSTVGVGQTLKPLKTLGNLVTRIGALEFSPDGQILCMASAAKRNALRLGE